MSFLIMAIAGFLIGVLLNGLFAGYETGFYSADRLRIQHLAEEKKNPNAALLLKHIHHPDKMLTIVLVGTNMALIFGTMALASVIEREWLVLLIATPAFLVFAEIVPKSVFRRHPNRLSLTLLPVIRVFGWLLYPLILPTLACLNILRRIFNVQEETSPIMKSSEDLRNLIDESAAHGSIEKEEQEMIHSVMDLQSTQAKEIMIPRIDMKALPSTATRSELHDMFRDTGLTRIPIYTESIDTVSGLVNAYDVLLDIDFDNESIERFIRNIAHVPDTKPVDDLLQELKKSGQHLAIVTDEYGGTDGLITLEDILEEIFGEIHDEHDQAMDLIRQVGPQNYVVDARLSLEEVSEVVGYVIQDDDVETIGGWVMRRAGRIPLQGEKLSADGFRVTILEGRGNRIAKVRMDVLPAAVPRTDTE
ncbi:MAG: hypothetical protein COA73_10030 [Candidatus Hydrogenedentota bacterium]|nr:MAG: hypothetical protein COA73_10030 [Candidatus Hydrogenedentota bacterium]